MLFYRNNIKLESHNRKIAVQFLNTGKLNNMFLNKPWIEERKKKEGKTESILNWNTETCMKIGQMRLKQIYTVEGKRGSESSLLAWQQTRQRGIN